MPYIKPEERWPLLDSINNLTELIDTPGKLNYVIAKTLHNYLIRHKLNYTSINEVVGVLECAKAELLRVVAGPYEDQKRALNGPVSDLDDDSHERMT